MAVRIPTINKAEAITDANGRMTDAFLRTMNKLIDQYNGLAVTVEDIGTGQEQSNAEQSLVNSGVISASGPFTVTSTGVISIPEIVRRYGNPALNPDVTVQAGVIPTVYQPDETIYVYYNDPDRQGGSVAYQISIDAGDAVQTGDTHSIGYVVVPASGTASGVFTTPPGA